jgi:hypothetical protein
MSPFETGLIPRTKKKKSISPFSNPLSSVTPFEDKKSPFSSALNKSKNVNLATGNFKTIKSSKFDLKTHVPVILAFMLNLDLNMRTTDMYEEFEEDE